VAGGTKNLRVIIPVVPGDLHHSSPKMQVPETNLGLKRGRLFISGVATYRASLAATTRLGPIGHLLGPIGTIWEMTGRVRLEPKSFLLLGWPLQLSHVPFRYPTRPCSALQGLARSFQDSLGIFPCAPFSVRAASGPCRSRPRPPATRNLVSLAVFYSVIACKRGT
jgi:hypothetical protein